jgi:hypothetical protein
MEQQERDGGQPDGGRQLPRHPKRRIEDEGGGKPHEEQDAPRHGRPRPPEQTVGPEEGERGQKVARGRGPRGEPRGAGIGPEDALSALSQANQERVPAKAAVFPTRAAIAAQVKGSRSSAK